MKSRAVTTILSLLLTFGLSLLPPRRASAVIYGVVDSPEDIASFADMVVRLSPGSGTVAPNNNPQSANEEHLRQCQNVNRIPLGTAAQIASGSVEGGDVSVGPTGCRW